MSRLLLRLLLIVSLVCNGAAAPWAVAKAPEAPGAHDHPAMISAPAPHAMPGADCHHEGHRPAHAAGSHHAGHDMQATTGETEHRSCCDGSLCKCGCTPPSLPRLAMDLPVMAWAAAPVAEPATRALVRRTAPPFRPPAG